MTIKHEEISKRAREIWEREDRPEGRDKEHWLQAEAELHLESEKGQTQSSLANHENSLMKTAGAGDMNREGGNHKRSMRRGR